MDFRNVGVGSGNRVKNKYSFEWQENLELQLKRDSQLKNVREMYLKCRPWVESCVRLLLQSLIW